MFDQCRIFLPVNRCCTAMLTTQDMHNLCCQRVPRALGNLRFDIQVIKYMQLTDIEPNSDLYSIWQACRDSGNDLLFLEIIRFLYSFAP